MYIVVILYILFFLIRAAVWRNKSSLMALADAHWSVATSGESAIVKLSEGLRYGDAHSDSDIAE